tara:strand:- start:768 stop:869 length:102 start_codon:yes stop_codon:yes gene_type:complete
MITIIRIITSDPGDEQPGTHIIKTIIDEVYKTI